MWHRGKAARAAPCRISITAAAVSTTSSAPAAATSGVVTAGPLSSMNADLYESLSETTSVQGVGVLPYYYGVPAGRLYSQGTYVSSLPTTVRYHKTHPNHITGFWVPAL